MIFKENIHGNNGIIFTHNFITLYSIMQNFKLNHNLTSKTSLTLFQWSFQWRSQCTAHCAALQNDDRYSTVNPVIPENGKSAIMSAIMSDPAGLLER